MAATLTIEQWITQEFARGCTPVSLKEAMIKAGHAPDFSEKLLKKMLGEHVFEQPAAPAVTNEKLQSSAHAAAEPALHNSVETVYTTTEHAFLHPTGGNRMPEPQGLDTKTNHLDLGDRTVRAILSFRHPRIVLFESLLSVDECDELISLARPRLSPSLTVDRDTGDSVSHKARVSQGMFFQRGENGLVARLENRISRLLRWPVDHAEGLQVLNYSTGGQYEPHNDYFSPQELGTPKLIKKGGQRLATVIIYLNTPKAGGSTTFPESGVTVSAVKGNALFFSYATPGAETLTLHGGDPVTVGEKWIATKWLRERSYV